MLLEVFEHGVPLNRGVRQRKKAPQDHASKLVLAEVQRISVRSQVQNEPVVHPTDAAGELEAHVELVANRANAQCLLQQSQLLKDL